MNPSDVTGTTERERTSLRLPPDIMRRCRMAAAAEGISVNAYLAATLDGVVPHYQETTPAPVVG
jgi:predicted HicB family RNase H-like nuclease